MSTPSANQEFYTHVILDPIESDLGDLTKEDVGLSNVDNTSDTNKPVSTAQASAIAAAQAFAIQRSNHTGTQTVSSLSDFVEAVVDLIATALVAGTNVDISYNDTTGEITVNAVGGGGGIDTANSPNANEFARFTDVDTIEGRTVSETKADLSLDNVTNTSDANKPVSTAQQTALDLKAPLASPTFTGTVTVPDGSFALAKLANMATASLIYRKTAGAGAPEVNTLATLKTDLGLTGTNSGDQTSIVGITGTIAQFNTAITDGDLATGGGTATGTNTGDNATNSQYSGLAASKQDTLVSATNIKTINGQSVLGSGNLSVSGSTTLTEQADPATPNANEFAYYAKKFAGRGVFTTINDDGLISPMQPAIYDNATYWWTPTAVTAGLWLNTAGAGAGTFASLLPTMTNAWTAIRRSAWRTVVTTANQQVGQRSSEALFFRGAAARMGGFFFFCRFGIENWTAGDRLFVGLTIGTTAIVTVQPSTLLNTCGFGIDAGDTAISFMHNNGSGTATKEAIAGQPALAANNGYDAYIYCKPNDTTLYYRLDNIVTGLNIIESSVTLKLPANTTLMMAAAVMSNGANTPVNSAGIGVSDIYVETDR